MDKAKPFPRLTSVDRSQLILHSVDVENLIEQDHSGSDPKANPPVRETVGPLQAFAIARWLLCVATPSRKAGRGLGRWADGFSDALVTAPSMWLCEQVTKVG